jgi:hypothetical protein
MVWKAIATITMSQVGWAKALTLPTEECGFTSRVGKMAPLPALHWNNIRVHFSSQV